MVRRQDYHAFLTHYFRVLFEEKNVEALDEYLADTYYDDDIGPECTDHKENSKRYVRNLFTRFPDLRVRVTHVREKDEVVTAYLEWVMSGNGHEVLWKKGIGIFHIHNNRILRRHTYIYYGRDQSEPEIDRVGI